ncbi:MAG: TonB-dependent receptor [Rhodospirillaceae bacterium]
MRTLLAGVACLALSSPALAQRANENAINAAQDAFGTQVGNESIGLYNAMDVRGFSPTEAGNLRLEGLYFDRQGDTTNRIVSGSTVRVGLSAQSYPFMAPTGVVDYRLRTPGDRRVTSLLTTFGPFDAMSVELDTQLPLNDKLSMGAGVAGIKEKSPSDTRSWVANMGAIFRWRPNDNVEIIPFGAVNFRWDRESGHTITTAGPFLPPEVDRDEFYGQYWIPFQSQQSAWGFIARADLGDDWTFRTGWFRSLNWRVKQGEALFRNTRENGLTDRFAVIIPGNILGSWSGEARLSKVIVEGPRRHTLHGSFRGRFKTRTFGGSTTIPLGPGVIGVADYEPEPSWTLGPQSAARVRQGTGGVAYEGLWPRVGEVSFGVQKTFYRRISEPAGGANVVSKDSPWLFNGTVAAYLSDDLALYGSWTRGLEESGEAPQTAVNRGESVPATRTEQIDAGFRYTIKQGLRIVGGVFEVKKPYFNVNTNNFFLQVGDVRHRGAELSLTGQIFPGLTVVAGTVLLKARVEGQNAAAGLIGAVPLGRFPHIMRLNMQYGPKSWNGFSIDTQIENVSSRYADLLDRVRAPAYTTVNIGGRYAFRLAETPATLRIQAQNITDVFAWSVSPTASFSPIDQRRFVISLTADF